MKPQIDKIHSRALLTAQTYKRCEFDLIDILEEVDRHRVFVHYGYGSLFKYATDALKLSDEVAYIFINVARKTREVPALKDEIKNGHITVSKAKKISAVLTAENQDHWFDLAKTSSKHQLEKQIASAAPEKMVRDLLTYVHPQDEVAEKAKIIQIDAHLDPQPTPKQKCRVQLQVGVSEALMLKIRQAQDVLSQKRKRNVGLEEVLAAMAEQFLQKNDPLEKAKRQIIRGEKPQLGPGPVDEKTSSDNPQAAKPMLEPQPQPLQVTPPLKMPPEPSRVTSPLKPHRQPLPAKTRHKVWHKHSGQCAHVSTDGKKCSQRRFLEIHHLQSIVHGGSNEISNLTLLCSGHHKTQHLVL